MPYELIICHDTLVSCPKRCELIICYDTHCKTIICHIRNVSEEEEYVSIRII